MVEEILGKLKSLYDPAAVAGMIRFGINSEGTYGIPMPTIREMARGIGQDHELARELWQSGIHEARILASLVDEPEKVTGDQMEEWVKDFDSWDVCDQVCMNLFDKTPHAYEKAGEWSKREEEFVKRAGFVMMAALAIHDKNASDEAFLGFLGVIDREACDGRNFVKKAVNWALRQIGKRDIVLNGVAIETVREIQKKNDKHARWIASDALRELTNKATVDRIRRRDDRLSKRRGSSRS